MKKYLILISFSLCCQHLNAQVYKKNPDPVTNYLMSDSLSIIFFKANKTDTNTGISSFFVYAFQKLWLEDVCGRKGYRKSLFEYLYPFFYQGSFYEKDILSLFGKPDEIQYSDNKRTKSFFYDISFENNCKKVNEYVIFDIIISTGEVLGPQFNVNKSDD